MKKYNLQRNVGSVHYVVSYHDGVKKHKDGSEFYDIALFQKKIDTNIFIKDLEIKGYINQSL